MNTSHFSEGQKTLNNEIKKISGPDTEIEYGYDSGNRILDRYKLRITISGKEHMINTLDITKVEELGNPNNKPNIRKEILKNLLQLIKQSISNN